MAQPPPVVDPVEVRSAGDPDRETSTEDPRTPERISGGRARAAGRSLEPFCRGIGWGLLALGVLSCLSRCLESAVERPADLAPWVQAGVDGVFRILAFGLAGLGTARLGRIGSALIVERIDRAERHFDPRVEPADRIVAALERGIGTGGSGEIPAPGPDPAEPDRARALAAIVQATRSEQWAEAASILTAFEARFPDHPSLPPLRVELDQRQRRATQEQIAQLEAARHVNDTARVLVLYQAMAPSLEPERRTALDHDLARWFLSVIHRRLRTSRIQAETVVLATQVAETFATTVEGASLRAALPTLRRSVGLCPRCAEPYTGTAEACPRCRSVAPVNQTPASSPGDPDFPEDFSMSDPFLESSD